jgi:hypothetical protein
MHSWIRFAPPSGWVTQRRTRWSVAVYRPFVPTPEFVQIAR